MTAAPGWTALLGGVLFRRTRPTKLGLVTVASLFTAQAGCGPETSMTEATESGTSESSSTPPMSTGDAPNEASSRMFGQFHGDDDYVGLTVSQPPDDLLFWYPWSMLQVERDGSLMVRRHGCQKLSEVQRFTWEHIGGNILQVVPAARNSDGTFRYKAVDVMAVTLTPGPGCDDIEEVVEYLPDSGKSTHENLHLPGEVCTEDDTPDDPKDCNFTFVWCEAGAPPACTADAS